MPTSSALSIPRARYCPLAFRKAVNEEAMPANLEQDDGAVATGFPATFASDPLFEDTATEVGIPPPGPTAFAASSRSSFPKSALRANLENSFVL